MGENLQDNPFAALFSSTSSAANFSPPVITEEDKKVSSIVEDTFFVTLQKDPTEWQSRTGCLVFIPQLSDEVGAQKTIISLDLIGRALFERLVMEDPKENVIHNGKSTSVPLEVIEKNVIDYLFHCFCRLSAKRNTPSVSSSIIQQLQKCIVENAITVLRSPELIESQDIPSQIVDLLKNDISNSLEAFIKEIVLELVKQNKEEQESAPEMKINLVSDAFYPVLDLVLSDMKELTLTSSYMVHANILNLFASVESLGHTLIEYSSPIKNAPGLAYTETLIGRLLSISSLPRTPMERWQFFDKPSSEPPQAISATENLIWSATSGVHAAVHTLFVKLLKSGTEVQTLTLNWIRGCIQANLGRGKLWNMQGDRLLSLALAPDGFILNLGSVLLRLCQPFCLDNFNSKLISIDPTYCAVTQSKDEKAVYVSGLSSESCLIVTPEGEERSTSDSFKFVTECFFLAHKLLDIGFRVVNDKLFRGSQELARTERLYLEAQSQAGSGSDAIESLQAALERQLTRHLSLKTALAVPGCLQMMAQLHAATATWLTQLAVEGATPATDFIQVKFPLPETVSKRLRYVPECIVENITEYVVFLRRFTPQTFDEMQDGSLEQILTFIIVYMGSPPRMCNPHLRAKLAECLESLMPHEEEQTNRGTIRPLGTFSRQQLFSKHPHRTQIVPSLLHVFVSIEMTGQSVAFEQKFNYRRPMYIIMDYLWKMEEHKQIFITLASEAEQNMDAMDPPLFLRFVNLLMNDAVFLLDEALSHMAQLREMQEARDSGAWRNLPAEERHQNEGNFVHVGMIARFDNILGRETIHTLELLTSEIKSIFLHPVLVDRIAAMLNYFLHHLVGPKNKSFKVKDQKEYEFNPGKIVTGICKMYINLWESDKFCRAVSQDGRSYSPQLFGLAEAVLVKIRNASMIPELQLVAEKVQQIATLQQSEEELLADAPEEFLDPIMSTLMLDPVVLPSSNITIDRSTIARHLLSDQVDPFNRNPLTMDMVTPNDELRAEIHKWVADKKASKNKNDNIVS